MCVIGIGMTCLCLLPLDDRVEGGVDSIPNHGKTQGEAAPHGSHFGGENLE